MALGKIKGNAFREFLVWFEARSGQPALTRAFGHLPAELSDELDPSRPALGVLASNWYSIEIVHSLLDTLTADLSPTDLERFTHEAAEATIARMMRGVQKAAFSLLISPRRYPKVINLLWGMNYDSGRVQVVEQTPTCHEGIVSDWRGHHPLICQINHLAKVHMYEAMGCLDVTVHLTRCVSKGDGDCRSLVRWR
ncbi:MAG: hypothetical protein HYZ29_29590 [Myxococcales bacterium]|nr:hypothetical protein [Myxococcales bacterium]